MFSSKHISVWYQNWHWGRCNNGLLSSSKWRIITLSSLYSYHNFTEHVGGSTSYWLILWLMANTHTWFDQMNNVEIFIFLMRFIFCIDRYFLCYMLSLYIKASILWIISFDWSDSGARCLRWKTVQCGLSVVIIHSLLLHCWCKYDM